MKTQQIATLVSARKALELGEQGWAFVVKRHGGGGEPEILVVSKSRSSDIRLAPKFTYIFVGFLARYGRGDGSFGDSQTAARDP